jgi:hypothetical protein
MTTLLARFLDELPDVLAADLLPKLDFVDLALLSRVNHAAREAVKASGLPRIGGSADGPRVTIERFCGGSVSLFNWVVAKGATWEKTTTCSAAALFGNVELLRWLREHDCPWDEESCRRAAAFEHFETLKWLRQHHCPWDEQTMGEAAYTGNMEMLSWLLEQGAPVDESVCADAAQVGQLEALQWLRERGCPWDEECCNAAAESGHWDVVMWARQHGCDWDEDVCLREVVFNGQLEVLRWMRVHEGVWDERICQYAVEFEQADVLRWAKDNNSPGADNY